MCEDDPRNGCGFRLWRKMGRLLAYTWGKHTLSMVGNAARPCVHADPFFPNLEPGENATIRGRIGFFEGTLGDFDYASFASFAGGLL